LTVIITKDQIRLCSKEIRKSHHLKEWIKQGKRLDKVIYLSSKGKIDKPIGEDISD
jgi:hypothetical protein